MTDPADQNDKLAEGEFMRLFVRHEPALRAFARTILPDWESVDDALQEASVTMWEKLDQLRDSDGFMPWAKVILRFKCLSNVASSRKHVLSAGILEQLADEAESLTSNDVSQVRQALTVCLKHFTASQQELLLAPYAGNGRVKQLAGNCGRSVNALYKLLGRLRTKLASCIQNRIRTEGV